jgi:uncharacterized protein
MKVQERTLTDIRAHVRDIVADLEANLQADPKANFRADPKANLRADPKANLQADSKASLKAIAMVYLFGSRASVDAEIGPLSDYDFGVLFDHDTLTGLPAAPGQIVAAFASEMTKALDGASVDVVVLNTAPPELAFAVISQGCILYERSIATRVDYEAYVMGLYGDYLPVLEAQRRQILEGGNREKRAERYREALGRTRRTLSAIATAAERDTP